MSADLAGVATVAALLVAVLCAAVATVFVHTLVRRPATEVSEQPRAATVVLGKVRAGESLTAEERTFAAQLIADRRNPAAYCLPGALFALGCLYVFGCLYELHGRPPSLHTWIGVLPMLGATNLTAQMLHIARLKKRLSDD